MIDRNQIEIRGAWRAGRMTLQSFALTVGAFLIGLRASCPELMEDLRILAVSENDAFPLPADLNGLYAVIQQWGWDRNANWAFEPMNPEDESPFPESTHPLGFRVELIGSTAYPGTTAKLRKLSIRAGGDGFLPNWLLMIFQSGDAERNLELQRRVLEVALQHLPLEYGVVTTLAFGDVVEMPQDLNPLAHQVMAPGMLTYLKRPGVIEALPADVRVERFGPDAGTLITLHGELGPVATAEQIVEAIRIRDALLPGGFLTLPPPPPVNPAARSNRKLRTRRRQ